MHGPASLDSVRRDSVESRHSPPHTRLSLSLSLSRGGAEIPQVVNPHWDGRALLRDSPHVSNQSSELTNVQILEVHCVKWSDPTLKDSPVTAAVVTLPQAFPLRLRQQWRAGEGLVDEAQGMFIFCGETRA
jgi:hypothetical protein